MASDVERGGGGEEEEESASELLRHQFRLSTIFIAEAEAHRNDHISASLRSYSNDLKAKEPQSDRKRKKITKKEDKVAKDVIHIADS